MDKTSCRLRGDLCSVNTVRVSVMISSRLVEVYSNKSISFHTAPFSGSMWMASSSHLLSSAPQLISSICFPGKKYLVNMILRPWYMVSPTTIASKWGDSQLPGTPHLLNRRRKLARPRYTFAPSTQPISQSAFAQSQFPRFVDFVPQNSSTETPR